VSIKNLKQIFWSFGIGPIIILM